MCLAQSFLAPNAVIDFFHLFVDISGSTAQHAGTQREQKGILGGHPLPHLSSSIRRIYTTPDRLCKTRTESVFCTRQPVNPLSCDRSILLAGRASGSACKGARSLRPAFTEWDFSYVLRVWGRPPCWFANEADAAGNRHTQRRQNLCRLNVGPRLANIKLA